MSDRPMKLMWTVDVPTVAGWFFWKPSETTDKMFRKFPPGVYPLAMTGVGEQRLHLAMPGDRNRYPAKWMGGFWAGPIEEPVTE